MEEITRLREHPGTFKSIPLSLTIRRWLNNHPLKKNRGTEGVFFSCFLYPESERVTSAFEPAKHYD
jgi:hypothetical protein